MVDIGDYVGLKSRCNRWRKQNLAALLCRLDLIILLFDSFLGLSTYNHVSLSSISPRGVNSDLTLPARDMNMFKAILPITVRNQRYPLSQIVIRLENNSICLFIMLSC